MEFAKPGRQPDECELRRGEPVAYDLAQNVDATKPLLPTKLPYRPAELFGTSQAMAEVLKQVQRVAPTSATVLITGESGTGKEIIATAIHEKSKRSRHPFVVLNCGAISPHLIESELFGHEKGSFTGALGERRGVFEQADGGTLFLDEVAEMPLELQVKLLRALETRRFVRVGGEREQATDIRVIAATNRPAEELMDPTRLRPDLFYRLQVFPIELPPLRKRKEDVGRFAKQFLQALNHADGNNKIFSGNSLLELQRRQWPGNLRELKNVVQRAYIMADRVISVEHLPTQLTKPEAQPRVKKDTLEIGIGTCIADVEKQLIKATLRNCGGNKREAAYILGISMKTLYNRIHEYSRNND